MNYPTHRREVEGWGGDCSTGWAGRHRQRRLQQLRASRGVHRPVYTTAAAQLGVRRNDHCVDDLVVTSPVRRKAAP